MLLRYNHILVVPLMALVFFSNLTSTIQNSTSREVNLTEPAPQIIITAPLINSVARPTLYVKAKTISNSDSVQLIIYYQNIILGTYYDSVDNYIDLSTFEGRAIQLTFKAIDKNNLETTSNPIPVFVESSHRLQEIYQASDRILDVNYNKMLVTEQASYRNPRIINMITGEVENLDINDSIMAGYLTTSGAMLESRLNGTSTLYQADAGKSILLGVLNSGSMKVAGTYCKWMKNNNSNYLNADTLFLRNVNTEENKIINTHVKTDNIFPGLSNSDVAANGTVVYIDSAYGVVKFENDTYTNITYSGYPMDRFPLTDGFNTAYQEQQGPAFYSFLSGPKGRVQLYSGLRGLAPVPNSWYQVNNRYCAYLDIPIKDVIISALLKYEFRILDTAGKMIIIDSLPRVWGVGLDLLNPKGDLMYFKPYRILSLFKSDTFYISSSLGKTFYRDSSWYIAIGRSLFKVVLYPGQDEVHNSTLYVAKDSVHLFVNSDFSSNFEGPGQIVKIKISGLPVNGAISKSGIPVSVNDEISVADINKLSYLPNHGYTGIDSLTWNAYDGFSYTPSNAVLMIKVQAKPANPVLTGLKETYCINEGKQNIKIANYPPTDEGYSVTAKLDNDNLVVSVTDSSFSFSPSAYAEGNHVINTTFTNVAGSSTDTSNIFIKSMVTPIVKVTSNITNVVDLSIPVTLTSTNMAGGGGSPAYTFAWDLSFTNILQGPGSNNLLVIEPTKLTIGNNWIYSRMKTSENCYSQQFAVDSINIIREAITGITDPDEPGKIIKIYPNPFVNQVYINGLNTAKKYIIVLYPVSGQSIFSKTIYNSSAVTIPYPGLTSGTYFLTIYNASKGKFLGTAKLIKE